MQQLMYLHIGYPKTGTTGLQQFFADNSDRLLAHGILYPKTGRIRTAHYALNFSLGIGEYDKSVYQVDKSDVLRSSLLEEVKATPCRAVLISSEYFVTSKSPARIYDFFSEFDVHPIIYLRRHDHAFESNYGQSATTNALPPWGPGIESFILYQLGISTIPYDYLGTLRKWAAAFGSDKLVVRPYERGQLKPDLYADMLSIIGITEMADLTFPSDELNVSPSPEIIYLLDQVQRTNLAADVKQRVVASLVEYSEQVRPAKPASQLSPPLRNALVSRYCGSYAVIAREFLGRSNGILFEEPMPDPSSPWTPPHLPNTPEAVNLLLSALTGRLRR